MKEIFETWLGIFFLTILMVAGLSVVTAGIDARNADAAKTAYTAEIEESNFSAGVIGAVINEANADGYNVELDLYHSNPAGGATAGDRTVTRNVTEDQQIGDTSDVYMARLQLTFDYSFPMLNAVTEHTLFGYAR